MQLEGILLDRFNTALIVVILDSWAVSPSQSLQWPIGVSEQAGDRPGKLGDGSGSWPAWGRQAWASTGGLLLAGRKWAFLRRSLKCSGPLVRQNPRKRYSVPFLKHYHTNELSLGDCIPLGNRRRRRGFVRLQFLWKRRLFSLAGVGCDRQALHPLIRHGVVVGVE